MKIYCIENIVNGKKYVGLTKGTIERRFKAHKEKSRGNSEKQHLHNAIQKHGIENFKIYQLDSATSFEELCEKEKEWIKKLNTKVTGYNETDGGEGSLGRKMLPETRAKIGNAIRGRKQTEEEKERRSESNKGIHSGENNPFYGKTHDKKSITKFLTHKSKCKYCGIEAINGNIKRWHNDNCKFK